MTDTAPIALGGCDENLPLLPIMRQFDFGQFVFLHDRRAATATARPRIGEVSPPIVIDPSGGRRQALQDWIDRARDDELRHPALARVHRPVPLDTDLLGGVSLHKLFEASDAAGPIDVAVPSVGLAGVIETRRLDHDGKSYTLDLDAAATASLARGEPTLVLATNSDGTEPPFMTQLTPELLTVDLDLDAVDGLLASGELRSNGAVEHVEVRASMAHALLAGEPAVAWTDGGNTILRLVPPSPARRPAAPTAVIDDLATFLGRPEVDGVDGQPLPVRLDAANVHELRETGVTTIAVEGTTVSVRDRGFGSAAATAASNLDRTTMVPFEGGTVLSTTGPKTKFVPTPEVGTGMVAGLRVAVFMPWRQTWELVGFSRGELRSSLALAPQEETTIEVSSWERRMRSLDQSSASDVDQSFESSQSERASDDVFNEMTKHHEFTWQLEGSLDATYSTGSGSISVSAGGQVSDASQLQAIARNTKQGMKESTQKSAARIRALRTTHITDAIEGGSQSRVTRHIKNPNLSHTLTLDFFETLAHYKVTLEAVPERLKLVALLANPIATRHFTRDLIRSNEIALRRALLDPSLESGFEACRKTSAYDKAIAIINEQAAMGAIADNATKPTSIDTVPPPPPLPKSPQEQAVVELLKQVKAACTKVFTSLTHPGAEPLPFEALAKVEAGTTVTQDECIDAQHWLFLKLCSKFLPGLIETIRQLPDAPTIDHAGGLVAVIPPPGATMSFAKFMEVSNADKEWAGLGKAIEAVFGRDTMGRANGLCLAENLYSPNDGGLAGLTDNLWIAYKAYLSKKSAGDFKEEKDVAIANANASQDKLSTADKLAMAFPLDELASAREREEALRAHLDAHADHYSFALFQGLSPAEQSRYIQQAGLEVGTFEPRVIAINGADLAVPLAPPPLGELRTFIEGLRESFATAFGSAVDEPESFIFPTAGMTINSRLGKCSACEDFIEDSRAIELRRLGAVADAAEHEAARLHAAIDTPP